MSPSPDSHSSGSTPRKDGRSSKAVQPDAAKREASPSHRLRSHLASRSWNFWYVILGAWMLVLLGQLWYQSTQVASIPYSRFLE